MNTQPNPRFFNKTVKALVLQEQDFKCAICKCELGADAEADHIHPWSKGGKTDPDNCQLLCGPCNRDKSNSTSGDAPIATKAVTGRPLNFNKDAYRDPQRQAHEFIIDALCAGTDDVFGLLGYPRFGKSDLQRLLALDAIERGLVAPLAFAINSRVTLQRQIADYHSIDAMIKRYSIKDTSRPLTSHSFAVVTNDHLATAIRAKNRYMLSLTVQSIAQARAKVHLRKILEKTCADGKRPLVFIDEAHDFAEGDSRTWFAEVTSVFGDYNPIIISMTGTAERDDALRTPGFKLIPVSEQKVTASKVRRGLLPPTDERFDPDQVLAEYDVLENITRRVEIKPIHDELNFPLKLGFANGSVCHIHPVFLDADLVTSSRTGSAVYSGRLSDASVTELRDFSLIREAVTDPRTIRKAMVELLSAIEVNAPHGHRAKAMVFCTDDRDSEADAHAKQILDILNEVAEERGVDAPATIITMNSATDDSQAKKLENFKTDSNAVAILKRSGATGFDCPRVKVVCDLGASRTNTTSIQMWLRGATPWTVKDITVSRCSLILPEDALSVALYRRHINSAGGDVSQSTSEKVGSEVLPVDDKPRDEFSTEIENVYATTALDSKGVHTQHDDAVVLEFVKTHHPRVYDAMIMVQGLTTAEAAQDLRKMINPHDLDEYAKALEAEHTLVDPEAEIAQIRAEIGRLRFPIGVIAFSDTHYHTNWGRFAGVPFKEIEMMNEDLAKQMHARQSDLKSFIQSTLDIEETAPAKIGDIDTLRDIRDLYAEIIRKAGL